MEKYGTTVVDNAKIRQYGLKNVENKGQKSVSGFVATCTT